MLVLLLVFFCYLVVLVEVCDWYGKCSCLLFCCWFGLGS